MIPIVILLLISVFILYFIYIEIKSNKKSYESFIQKLATRLDGVLKASPSDTGWSSNRLIFLISNMLADIITWGGVLTLFLITDKFPDIPEGLLWLYALAKGLTAASKLVQKPFDNKLSEVVELANTNRESGNTSEKKETLND